jgi:hypothetical protein
VAEELSRLGNRDSIAKDKSPEINLGAFFGLEGYPPPPAAMQKFDSQGFSGCDPLNI